MYNWIADTLGLPDGLARGLAFAVALAIVLLLIALFVFILKRLTGARLTSGRNRQPRVAVMDAMNIDTRRRLLLIRRDNVEHLVLVGGSNDLVIEQGIVKAAALGVPAPSSRGAASHSAQPSAEMAAQALPSSVAVAAYSQPQHGEEPAAAPGIAPATANPSPVSTAPVSTARAEPATVSGQQQAYPSGMTAASVPGTAQTSQYERPAAPRTEPRPAFQRAPSQEPASPERNLVRAAVSSPAARAPYKAPEITSAVSPQGKAPSVGIAPAKTTAAAPPSGSQVAGFARSLARPALAPASSQPLPPRQVTPPSSGPAAKAKTAFLQPVGLAEPAGERHDPAPGKTASPAAAEQKQADATAPSPLTPAAASAGPAAAQEPAKDQVPDLPLEQAPGQHAAEEAPSPAPDATSSAETETKADPGDEPLVLDETMVATASAKEETVETKRREPAEDADIFEPAAAPAQTSAAETVSGNARPQAAPEGAATETTSSEENAAAEKPADGTAQEQLSIKPVIPEIQAPVPSPEASPAKAPEITMNRPGEARVAPPIRVERPKDGPLPNPIEDEMAKLLEEMSGPQKS